MANLAQQLKAIQEKTGLKAQSAAIEFGSDLLRTVIMNTPVDTGFLRGSWNVSLNAPGTTASTGTADPSGATAVANGASVLNGLQIGDTVYYSNGANYAVHVEFGTSRMAPRGFVRKTVLAAGQIAQDTIRRLGS